MVGTRPVHRWDAFLGQAVREPMLVEHPSGALFVAGYSRDEEEAADPPNLYRGDDGGTTWRQVDVGEANDGALGNSDVDLVVGPDGTLYFLTMGFDRAVGEGTHVALGISGDVGRTWSWTQVDLEAHMALIDPADPQFPVEFSTRLTVDAWVGSGPERRRDPAGEYFPVTFLSNGDLAAVLPIQASERGDGLSWIRLEH